MDRNEKCPIYPVLPYMLCMCMCCVYVHNVVVWMWICVFYVCGVALREAATYFGSNSGVVLHARGWFLSSTRSPSWRRECRVCIAASPFLLILFFWCSSLSRAVATTLLSGGGSAEVAQTRCVGRGPKHELTRRRACCWVWSRTVCAEEALQLYFPWRVWHVRLAHDCAQVAHEALAGRVRSWP